MKNELALLSENNLPTILHFIYCKVSGLTYPHPLEFFLAKYGNPQKPLISFKIFSKYVNPSVFFIRYSNILNIRTEKKIIFFF